MSEVTRYLERHEQWSAKTFGQSTRTEGVCRHIEKELAEIRSNPHDLEEWVDVIILAMDGFWRHGGAPWELLPMLRAKQDKNFARQWPFPPPPDDFPSEHNKASGCKWCDEGYAATNSSVSSSTVHTDTPVGRVVCTNSQRAGTPVQRETENSQEQKYSGGPQTKGE